VLRLVPAFFVDVLRGLCPRRQGDRWHRFADAPAAWLAGGQLASQIAASSGRRARFGGSVRCAAGGASRDERDAGMQHMATPANR